MQHVRSNYTASALSYKLQHAAIRFISIGIATGFATRGESMALSSYQHVHAHEDRNVWWLGRDFYLPYCSTCSEPLDKICGSQECAVLVYVLGRGDNVTQ